MKLFLWAAGFEIGKILKKCAGWWLCYEINEALVKVGKSMNVYCSVHYTYNIFL